MTPSNDHMTAEEVFRVLHSRACPQKDDVELRLEEHLRQCKRCTQVVEEYQRFMPKLYEFRDPKQPATPCPDRPVWGELASGLVSQNEAAQYLQHAASCSSCTEELLYALDALSSNDPPPAELQLSLTTATPEWQKQYAVRISARQAAIDGPAAQAASFAAHPWRRVFPAWAFAGLAGVATLAVAIGVYTWLRGSTSETLIREAYTQQRTVEMRILGAGYSPVQVQRTDGHSQINSPRALLEAEVMIKRGLEKRPDDIGLLRQKAEADLLNWNYQPALETVNRAASLKPASFELLVDTATAYFERAEATSNPADYEAGLQSLGNAIQLKPDDPTALFNRAILCERLYFYGRAIADWEQFLKIEKDPGWRREAEQRLNEVRERLRQQGSRPNPDQLTAAEFKDQVVSRSLSDPEEYAEAAERRILPGISAVDVRSQAYQAASSLAETLKSRHSDPFLNDLLLSATDPRFHRAMRLLGQSSSANHIGRYEQAFVFALHSASLFRRIGNGAGALAARFEQLYALQFEAKAVPCAVHAARAVDAARASRYAILEVQLLLEQAICSDMRGDLRTAKELTLESLALAKTHGYMSFYLRGLTVLADLDDQEGDESGAWSAIHEGLGLYWTRGLPPLRAYSLYVVLDFLADRLGHDHVQFAAAFEAVNFGFQNPDRNVEASERVRLANAALRTGELHVAQGEFERASHILAAAPQTGSVRWRELEAWIGVARVHMIKGEDFAQTAEALLVLLPELQHVSNRYVEFQYYQTLAELKWRLRDTEGTKRFVGEAIRSAETGLRSLAAWKQRSAWMDQHRQAYILMTHVLFRMGEGESALNLWEHFRTADATPVAGADATANWNRGAPKFAPVTDRGPPATAILTYALGQQRLVIWVRSESETHAVYVREPLDLRRTAENFISECARPDSDLASVQADAHRLYRWLIEPVSQWLPPQGHLLVEPDGILTMVPFEALMGPETTYLGARYAITVAASVRARIQATDDRPLLASARALIVAAPADLNVPAEPPPGARTESLRLAQRFQNPVLLVGKEARILPVQRELSRSDIFHFAGHGALGRSGAAMIMADGALGIDQTRTFSSGHLDHLRLAVLSACDTARPSEMLESDGLVSEFLQAGAGNVVASRWSVDSLATTDFMELLYGSVLSGDSIADSLKAAAQTLRGRPGRAHPYYWAGFSTFGRS